MPYTPTDTLQSRIESLRQARPRTSYASGLAQGLRDWKAGRLEKDLESKQAENEKLKQQELQMLLNALTGAQAPMKPGMTPNFQHPDVQQLALAQALQGAQPKAPIKANAGDVFLDPRTMQPITSVPEKVDYNKPFLPDGTPNTAYQEYDFEKSTRGATNVNTTVVPKAENAYLSGRAGSQATQMSELEKAASSAYQANVALDRFVEASANGDAGGAQGLITGTKNLLASFGISPDSLVDTATMQQAIGGILGAKMAELGARGLTDRDMDVLREMLPRVNTSHEARVEVARILKQSNETTIQEYIRQAQAEQQQYPDYNFMRPGWFEGYGQQGGAPGSATSDDIVEQARRILQGGN